MIFNSTTQLKDWIKNKAREGSVEANAILQNYMMERFLERMSLSRYRNNMIIKGGFLIAAMIGVDKRSTMDMDLTIKSLSINRESIEEMIKEIILIDIGDNISFETQSIKPIHDADDLHRQLDDLAHRDHGSGGRTRILLQEEVRRGGARRRESIIKTA